MKTVLALAVLLFTVSSQAQPPATTHNYEFANGNWFDGKTFVRRTFYSVGGKLTSKRPARVDRVFDLTGRLSVRRTITISTGPATSALRVNERL